MNGFASSGDHTKKLHESVFRYTVTLFAPMRQGLDIVANFMKYQLKPRKMKMPVKYKASNIVKSPKQRMKSTHYYMHTLDNKQLWQEFFGTSNKKNQRKMRNELAMRGFTHQDILERTAER